MILLLSRAWLIVLIASVALFAQTPTTAKLTQEVGDTERAFARTMAQRDFAAFGTFLADEAVFMNGNNPLRGRKAILNEWQRFYTGSQAPFSWEPDQVEVLPSGTLALTAGPVRDAKGTIVSRFSTIWRLEAPGQWRVIFDKGEPVCK